MSRAITIKKITNYITKGYNYPSQYLKYCRVPIIEKMATINQEIKHLNLFKS
jgi:hypothetical protein